MTSAPLWRGTRRAEELRAPLLIIGAGVTGLSAAIAARARGLGALIVSDEAGAPAASARNAGYLMRGAAENYHRAIQQWGRERARTLWRWSEENLALLRALGVAREPSYQSKPSCLLALEAEEAGELERSVELMREDGFEASLIKPGGPRAGDDAWARLAPLNGLENSDDASVNPEDVLSLLRSKIERPVLSGWRISRLEQASSHVVAHSEVGRILADRVLIATNAYAGELVPALEGVVTPNRGQMIAIDAPALRLDASYYANFGGEYFRITHNGHLVVGGFRKSYKREERTTRTDVTKGVQHKLQQFAEHLLGAGPGALGARARWAGTMGFSPDGMPLIGPIDATGKTWFCGGFTGHGMSLGARSAEAAIEAMQTDAETPFPLVRALADSND